MAILYPASLANLVVEVGTRHCHQTLLKGGAMCDQRKELDEKKLITTDPEFTLYSDEDKCVYLIGNRNQNWLHGVQNSYTTDFL